MRVIIISKMAVGSLRLLERICPISCQQLLVLIGIISILNKNNNNKNNKYKYKDKKQFNKDNNNNNWEDMTTVHNSHHCIITLNYNNKLIIKMIINMFNNHSNRPIHIRNKNNKNKMNNTSHNSDNVHYRTHPHKEDKDSI